MLMQSFATREEASAFVAARIADLLRQQLESSQRAAFVVSGGSTPLRTFELLSQETLSWQDVTAVMSDERWVAPHHPDSNEGFLRNSLAQSHASPVNILPFFEEGTTAAGHCDSIETAMQQLERFSCGLLGMGEDGHFASLFPDANTLAQGLDPESGKQVIAVSTAASPHARISLTLPALLQCRELLLLIFGEAKREVVTKALEPDSPYPVAHLLQQEQTPVHIIWAP